MVGIMICLIHPRGSIKAKPFILYRLPYLPQGARGCPLFRSWLYCKPKFLECHSGVSGSGDK
ncbi:hypothetical protein KIN20_028300 [Parelaphostrongylus tenuis]|uniref:Uncharacterized protein n=1 Tax=Parelaphostrongylus tenuis TaxID=148309 RepID=A0AAD5R129_PARTN|nr:hypothetical protein KIN20_028300 [Parelaphostrongylus tenuis]